MCVCVRRTTCFSGALLNEGQSIIVARALGPSDAFTTNGDLGFTIASPVYDKNSTGQPVFLGVVAMDFKVEVSAKCFVTVASFIKSVR